MTAIEVDRGELEFLKREVGRAQYSLGEGIQSIGAVRPPPGAIATILGTPFGTLLRSPFGNTPNGRSTNATHSAAFDRQDSAMKAFEATAGADHDKLALALELYDAMDDESAEKLLDSGKDRLDIFTAHLSEGGTPEQYQQIAKELGALRGLVDPYANTVVTGDFNSRSYAGGATGPGEPPAKELEKFAEDGFDIHSGTINDGLGGTSLSRHPVDHVLTRGVGESEAQRWPRGQSDHDGQQVGVTMPAW